MVLITTTLALNVLNPDLKVGSKIFNEYHADLQEVEDGNAKDEYERIHEIMEEYLADTEATPETQTDTDLKLGGCVRDIEARLGPSEASELTSLMKWLITTDETKAAKYICFMAFCVLRVSLSNIQTIKANVILSFYSRFSSFSQDVIYPAGGIRHVVDPALQQQKSCLGPGSPRLTSVLIPALLVYKKAASDLSMHQISLLLTYCLLMSLEKRLFIRKAKILKTNWELPNHKYK